MNCSPRWRENKPHQPESPTGDFFHAPYNTPVRRLARILLNALTALSLLLFVATVVLWVRSYWRQDFFRRIRPGRPDGLRTFAFLTSARGGAQVDVGFVSSGFTGVLGREGWDWLCTDYPPTVYAAGLSANRWGFHYDSYDDPPLRTTRIIFPLWLPTALFAALPLARGALFIRRRRRGREGHCARCGYDLRATPERCPECGVVPGKTN